MSNKASMNNHTRARKNVRHNISKSNKTPIKTSLNLTGADEGHLEDKYVRNKRKPLQRPPLLEELVSLPRGHYIPGTPKFFLVHKKFYYND